MPQETQADSWGTQADTWGAGQAGTGGAVPGGGPRHTPRGSRHLKGVHTGAWGREPGKVPGGGGARAGITRGGG
jgi:hypothetical protein